MATAIVLSLVFTAVVLIIPTASLIVAGVAINSGGLAAMWLTPIAIVSCFAGAAFATGVVFILTEEKNRGRLG